jgi:vacuolar-type H+-ATPase subunit I/STV1
VINSLIGIAIGAFFASRTGDAKDYFLPGILWNATYMLAMLVSIVTRWPVVGFLIGSVTGDPTAWHKDQGIVRLCTRLTWLLMLPCAVRVAVQGPVYLFGGGDQAVAALGFAKIVMGWPLQVAAFAAMLWVLGRGRTPVKPAASV